MEKISQGLAEADREEFADDAEIEAEMRGIIADARQARCAEGADAPDTYSAVSARPARRF